MTDYTRYEPGPDQDGLATLYCADCDPSLDGVPMPIWVQPRTQVTPLSLANQIAAADEHERQCHAEDEPISDTDQAARRIEAAKRRYDSLRTHLFVTLSETCTVDHSGRAADAAAEAVRPELEMVYVGYLAAKDGRDQALAEVDRLRDETDALNASADRAATTWHDLVAERDQARALVRAAHTQAEGWRQHALDEGGDIGYTVMAHACCCILTALVGGQDAAPPDWVTGNGDETT